MRIDAFDTADPLGTCGEGFGKSHRRTEVNLPRHCTMEHRVHVLSGGEPGTPRPS